MMGWIPFVAWSLKTKYSGKADQFVPAVLSQGQRKAFEISGSAEILWESCTTGNGVGYYK